MQKLNDELIQSREDNKNLYEKAFAFDKFPYKKNITLIDAKQNYMREAIVKRIGHERINEIIMQSLSEEDQKKVYDSYKNVLIHTIPDQGKKIYRQYFEMGGNPIQNYNNFMAVINKDTSGLYDKAKEVDFADGYFRKIDKTKSKLFELLDKELDEEIINEIIDETNNFILEIDKPKDQVTYKPFKQEIDDLIKANPNLTPVESGKLNYIKENLLFCTKKFGSEIENKQYAYQLVIEDLNNKYSDDYKNNPNNKKFDEIRELVNIEYPHSFLIKGKEKVKDEIEKAEYDFSTETKNAMAKVMHEIDEMNIIDDNNVTTPEEGTKCYAFLNYNEMVNKISATIKKKDVQELIKLSDQFKDIKQKQDNLLKFAKENFNSNGMTYPGNVDVSRNGNMPYEYRSEIQAASLLSGLLIATKFCKYTNTPIDEFCKNPLQTYNKMVEKSISGLSIDKYPKDYSIGKKLGFLGVPTKREVVISLNISPLAMRAVDGLHGMEKDENKLEYNCYVRSLQEQNYLRITAQTSFLSTYFSKEALTSFTNIFSVKEKDVDLKRLCANPSLVYDYLTDKMVDKIDVKDYMEKNTYNYKEQKEFIENTIKDYFSIEKAYSQKTIDMLAGAKQAIENLLDVKKADSEKEDYKELENYGKQLDDPKYIKNLMNDILKQDIEKCKDTIFKLTGQTLDDEKEYNKILEYKDNQEEYLKFFFEKRLKNLYDKSLVRNGFSSKSEYAKLRSSLDLYYNAMESMHYNESFVEKNKPYKNFFSLEILGTQSKAKKEKTMLENCVPTLNQFVEEKLNKAVEKDEKKNRTVNRCNEAKRIIDESLVNYDKMNEAEKLDNLKFALNVLKHIEDKHASRNGLWKFVHYFGDYKKETNAINQMRESIQAKGVEETTINNLLGNNLDKDIDYNKYALETNAIENKPFVYSLGDLKHLDNKTILIENVKEKTETLKEKLMNDMSVASDKVQETGKNILNKLGQTFNKVTETVKEIAKGKK